MKKEGGRKGGDEGREVGREGDTGTGFSLGCCEVTLGSAYATCLVHNTSLNK